MNPKQLIDSIHNNERQASVDLDDIPFQMRPGHAVLIRRAKEQSLAQRQELEEQTIPHRLVGLIVSGPQTSKVKEVCNFVEENSGIAVDVSRRFTALAEQVKASMGRQTQFLATQHQLVVSYLTTLASSMGYRTIVAPNYKQATVLTFDDIVSHIRNIITESNGDQFLLKTFQMEVMDKIISGELAGPHHPVIVVGADKSEHPALSSQFSKSIVTEIPSNFEVSQQSITKLLKQ